MKLRCAPQEHAFPPPSPDSVNVVLFDRTPEGEFGMAGAAVKEAFLNEARLLPEGRAWDFLAIALGVLTADFAGHRDRSPDGWTREFELTVAVQDPAFWQTQIVSLVDALSFLTTDRWSLNFVGGGFVPQAPKKPSPLPQEDSVVLLSGGLDSLVGAIDLVAGGRVPFAISQIVRGDGDKQAEFAQRVGKSLRHLQCNHNIDVPDPETPPSQRARSIVFLAYGVAAATTLQRYQAGETIPLYICENAFISANVPLTPARIGSLSTRTTHPIFLKLVQGVLASAGLRVHLTNPYQFTTKGEMLVGCSDQALLKTLACASTSCGRFGHFGYKHCGRCVPCQIRRASFLKWGIADTTHYLYENLGIDDDDHARFDDVRAAALAVAEVEVDGLDAWIGTAFSSPHIEDADKLRDAVGRGLYELAALHARYGVK